nr:hypothetical protein [Tanacetum cinerariifolium]
MKGLDQLAWKTLKMDGLDEVVCSSYWYVVPAGRVVVPTGRYVVPAGRVVVPTG